MQEASDGLCRANRWAACVYAAEAVALLVMGKRAEVAVTTHYLTTDAVQGTLAGHTVLASATHQLFTVNVGYVVALALFALALSHAAAGTFWRAQYEAGLKKGTNLARWIGLGVGLGLTLLAVAMLAGVYDFSTLVMLFVLTLAMHLLGFVVEGVKKGSRLPFGLGAALGITALALVGFYAAGAGMWGGGHLPAYVTWAFVTAVVGLGLVGGNLYLQQRGKGKWTDYLYAERMYMVLGLVVTAAVAWQLFAGALKP